MGSRSRLKKPLEPEPLEKNEEPEPLEKKNKKPEPEKISLLPSPAELIKKTGLRSRSQSRSLKEPHAFGLLEPEPLEKNQEPECGAASKKNREPELP